MVAGLKNNKTILMIAILCLCTVAGTVGGVYAYLTAKTERLPNEFVPAKVACQIVESFEGGIKSNVQVENTGNVNAYIRATVVVTFVSDDGKILATAPIENVDYMITWRNGLWKKGSDGFWYYAYKVEPGATTANLIDDAQALTVPDGYHLNIQIVASAVQADPATAVVDAWGVTVTNNGQIEPRSN